MFGDLLGFEAGKVPFREPREAVPVALAEGSLLHWVSPTALTLRASQGSCGVSVPVFAAAAIWKAFLFLFSPLSSLVLLCQLPLPSLGKSWLAAGNESLPERELMVKQK